MVAALWLLSGAAPSALRGAAPSALRGAAPGLVDTRSQYAHVFDIYVPIGLGVIALFWLAIVVAVLVYRRRPPDRAARWHEHDRLEAAYALLLACVVALLLYITFPAEHRVDTVSASERAQLVVEVTAAKWEWHFSYPAYGIDLYSGADGQDTLVVPTGEAVRFRLSSVDVIHALWIPQLRYKHDAIPGSVQSTTLTFSRPGVFSGECAEFCGLRHSNMTFEVRAVSPAGFAAWARSRRPAGGGRA